MVLAAGASRRMGQTKQLLPLDGDTVLERTLKNLRSAEVNEVLLVLGARAEAILKQLPGRVIEAVKVVRNQNYESGMASSLREGLRSVGPDSDAALIVLADQPFVRPHTVARILERYRGSEADIVVPFYRGQRGNPVLLARSMFPEAMALEGDSGCRMLFRWHAKAIAQVEVDDPGILLDLDSREDYERLCGGR